MTCFTTQKFTEANIDTLARQRACDNYPCPLFLSIHRTSKRHNKLIDREKSNTANCNKLGLSTKISCCLEIGHLTCRGHNHHKQQTANTGLDSRALLEQTTRNNSRRRTAHKRRIEGKIFNTDRIATSTMFWSRTNDRDSDQYRNRDRKSTSED